MMERLKKCLFVFLLLFMFLPWIQKLTHIFRESELMGAYAKPESPRASMSAILSMDFQRKEEEYEKYNFGFRGFLIKLKNSVNYLLYREIAVSEQVEGKNGYVFHRGSIGRIITGELYNGKKKNDITVSKIKYLKDQIEKRGDHFLVVFAPSKESIYPEKLPDQYRSVQSKHNDYDELIEGFRKNNIPFIDFTPYFKTLHSISSYSFFTKTGYHWSVYGASIAQDSLLSYLQQKLTQRMPYYLRTGIEKSDTARWPDADFERPMNLLFNLQGDRYVYPKLEMVQSSLSNYRPKVIIIGDSYFSMIKDLNKLQYIFSEDSKYWYYFNKSLIMANNNNTEISDIDVLTELESADFVILLGSPATLDEFPYGVTDYYFDNSSKMGIVEKIKYYVRKIPGGMAAIVREANDKTIEKESLLTTKAKQIFKMGKAIHLKAANNKFVCADASKNNLVIANRDNASAWETFILLNLENNECAIYSYANKFLTVENGSQAEIIARRPADEWEIFTMIKLDSNTIALKASNGKYLGIDETREGQLFAKAGSIGKFEKFEMITNKKN